jgi:hypothetical protein
VRYFGERNPERFPSIEERRAAVGRYPEPMFSAEDEVLRVEEEDPHAAGKVYAASYLT